VTRALIAVATAAVIVVVALVATQSDNASSYRVAVLFDTAKGMVSGQQVKVAGAAVGTVKDIELARGPKARMVLSIDKRFAPFHADASCSILPEGLISENYVECDPGSAQRALPNDASGVPTVALAHTTVPVSLQDVLNVFSLPTDQRLRILISELGIGFAGRGGDLNALLRRANPALTASRQVLTTFAGQRQQIAAAIGQTDQVLGSIAKQNGQVRAFVDHAATVATTTAQHSGSLGQAIQRLPVMLDAVRPGLRSLDRAATNASPLLDALRRSGPGLDKLTTTLPALTRAGGPALKALSSVAKTGRPIVRRAVPTASRLQRASAQLGALTPDIDQLLVSLRKTGGIESTMRLLYTLAALTATYDSTSHLINFIANVAPNCLAAEVLHTDSAGCSHKWSSAGQGTIPVNAPSCGPQKPEDLWRNHRCPLAVPVGTFPDLGALLPKQKTKRQPAKAPPTKPSAGSAPSTTTPAAGQPAPAAPSLDLPGILNKLLGGGQPPSNNKESKGLLDFLLK
jgi:virulence factor Mce-like protein